MNHESMKAHCDRFFLSNGQFFAEQAFKNLQWFINGQRFGFGDLRDRDILMIKTKLSDTDVFEGFNEHHMTEWMQCENPRVRITKDKVEYPPTVPVSSETRKKIRENSW